MTYKNSCFLVIIKNNSCFFMLVNVHKKFTNVFKASNQ